MGIITILLTVLAIQKDNWFSVPVTSLKGSGDAASSCEVASARKVVCARMLNIARHSHLNRVFTVFAKALPWRLSTNAAALANNGIVLTGGQSQEHEN